MKNPRIILPRSTAGAVGCKIAAVLFLLAGLHTESLFAQGTAFTYQGSLKSAGAPVTGSYDLVFNLYSGLSTGSLLAVPVTNNGVVVSNGLFTTTIDFGTNSFTGYNCWLEIAVSTNSAGNFSTLSPRQPVTPAPYAITAESLASVAFYNNITPGLNATVSGGDANTASNYFATVGGGMNNSSGGIQATVSGGDGNVSSGNASTVGGGQFNDATGDYSAVGGGENNLASGQYSTVAGGDANIASGNYSFAAGNGAQAIYQGDFVWADDDGGAYAATAANQFDVRAAGGINLAGDVTDSGALYVGGGATLNGNATFYNTATFNNTTSLNGNVTGLSGVNFATDIHMGTGSGDYHHFTLGGGNSYGYLFGSYPAFGDGVHLAYNYYADAAGTSHVINSGGATSLINAGYGVVTIYVGAAGASPTLERFNATTTGVTVYGTFNNSSDRNAKQDFAPVNAAQILDKVLQLPVTEWSYKMDSTTRHIGPMGQDFYAAFNIGTDERHIAPIDEGGVALVAIQALNQKLSDKDADMQKLKQQNDALSARLNDLEKLVQSLAPQK
jgi:hypothetical protein